MLVVPKDQHESKITNKCQRLPPPKLIFVKTRVVYQILDIYQLFRTQQVGRRP